MSFITKNKKYCVAVVLLAVCVAVFVTFKLVRAQLAVANFIPKTSYINPFSLGNGEMIDIDIRWNKEVNGFDLFDLAYSVKDNDGNGISTEINNDPSIKLPVLSNFIEIDKAHYRVTLTAPYQYYGPIRTGKLILSLSRRDNSIIGEPFDHNILEFTWGRKADCMLFPSKRHIDNNKSMIIALMWDRAVTNVTIDDIKVDKGTISNFKGYSSFMEATLTAPETGVGRIKITLQQDACSEGNNEVVLYVTYGIRD